MQKSVRYPGQSPLRVIALMLFAGVAIIIGAKVSGSKEGAFSLAEDCPRGALVYAQFADLPALVRQWDDSSPKQQYLASTSFRQLTGRHLALKLAERWEEFNGAVGFPVDLALLGASADNRAALAVYDIGRLELVLIAPLSAEKVAANRLLQAAGSFEEQELPDGTTYRLREVEADHGRQKQQIAFAAVRGRFVLATSERLLLRAIANINGLGHKDRLSDEPSFQTLSRETSPHVMTVWLDQTKLNGDWYFRHYWVMRNADELGQLRAGMLDFEMQDDKWIEHRNFLLAGGERRKHGSISPAEIERLAGRVPRDAPYFHLRALGDDPGAVIPLIREIFSARPPEAKRTARGWNLQYYEEDFESGGKDEWRCDDGSYASLDYRYDLTINDALDAGVSGDDEQGDYHLRAEAGRQAEMSLRQAVQPARPLFAATVTSLREAAGPLFAESGRAAILTLATPAGFKPEAFERALADLAGGKLMVAGSTARGTWESRAEGGARWRELSLPLVGWRLCYALEGRELILSSTPVLLAEMLTSRPGVTDPGKVAAPLSELTVIRLSQRQEAFDRVVGKLDAQRIKARSENKRGNDVLPSQEFFSGNLASLFGAASRAHEVQIRRSWPPGRLREDVSCSFQARASRK
ncbi:MAG TPA: hypothetical protein VFD58_26240 [Blastocatellia bacterium]|nr:hypothetical protein [Blastocatellia bacterium]